MATARPGVGQKTTTRYNFPLRRVTDVTLSTLITIAHCDRWAIESTFHLGDGATKGVRSATAPIGASHEGDLCFIAHASNASATLRNAQVSYYLQSGSVVVAARKADKDSGVKTFFI